MTDPHIESTQSLCWETNTWTGSGEGRHNEDFALIDQDGSSAVLVDGATGLTKANLVAGTSDAAWFAHTFCAELSARIADAEAATSQALFAAGEATAEAYRALPGADALARIDEPNGSLAVLRWSETHAEVSLLGDCTAAVLLRDRPWQVLHDDTLTKLDNENYERMYAYATERGTTMAQARRALNPRFIENRLKMNEPGGYWALDISCRGLVHLQTFAFDPHDVVALFACTDGYAAAVDMGVTATAAELAQRVMAGEGTALGEALRAAEHEDAGCWRVHRSKTSDDATYVLACRANRS